MRITRQTTVGELQDYIWRMNHERGLTIDDVPRKMLLLTEEVGELAKAIRKGVGLKFDAQTSTKEVTEELADVQIVLLGLASMLEVDMATAVEAKEQNNRQRHWK